jgi:hypothetical protein
LSSRLARRFRCFRVSGLLVRPFTGPLACMEIASGPNRFRALEALGHFTGFPDPVF